MPPKRGNTAPPKAKKGEASQKQSAAPKKSKQKSPAVPTTAYLLVKSQGYGYDGFHSPEAPTMSVKGVYPSENQAYAAAIRKLIAGLEHVQSSERSDLRDIATAKKLSLKQRFEQIESITNEVYGGGGEVVEFRVEKSEMFPLQTVKDNTLLDGLSAEVSANENESEYSRDSNENEYSGDSDCGIGVAL